MDIFQLSACAGIQFKCEFKEWYSTRAETFFAPGEHLALTQSDHGDVQFKLTLSHYPIEALLGLSILKYI